MLTDMAKLFADFAQEFKKSCKGFVWFHLIEYDEDCEGNLG